MSVFIPPSPFTWMTNITIIAKNHFTMQVKLIRGYVENYLSICT